MFRTHAAVRGEGRAAIQCSHARVDLGPRVRQIAATGTARPAQVAENAQPPSPARLHLAAQADQPRRFALGLCVVSDRPRRTLKLAEGQQLGESVKDALRAVARPALIVMSGQTVGERISVLGNVFIGRDPSAQLVLPDQGVSYRHACLEDRGGVWVLVDLGSTNGTKVNGERTAESPLKHGDRVSFGSTLVRFELQDETDQAYTEAVNQLLHNDDLTGLLLRRRFDAELELLVAQAASANEPLSLLAMDLDGIKAINDQHGHLFGAYTIAETGKLIGRLLPEGGIACRFGGDEFIVALAGHDVAKAQEVAQQLRVAVSEHAYSYDNIALHPSLSIGVAQFPKHAQEAGSLFRAADAALYTAKRNGKDRVELAV